MHRQVVATSTLVLLHVVKVRLMVDFCCPQVTKMLGNGRLEAMCFDGVKRLCHIRGKLRKKVWINQSDIILVGLRDYQVSRSGPTSL